LGQYSINEDRLQIQEQRVERAVVREEDALSPLDPDQVRVPGAEEAGGMLRRPFAAERLELSQQFLCTMDDLHDLQHRPAATGRNCHTDPNNYRFMSDPNCPQSDECQE